MLFLAHNLNGVVIFPAMTNPSALDNIVQFETLVQTNGAKSNTPDLETLSRTVDGNTRSGLRKKKHANAEKNI